MGRAATIRSFYSIVFQSVSSGSKSGCLTVLGYCIKIAGSLHANATANRLMGSVVFCRARRTDRHAYKSAIDECHDWTNRTLAFCQGYTVFSRTQLSRH